jgi:hypothetical protein
VPKSGNLNPLRPPSLLALRGSPKRPLIYSRPLVLKIRINLKKLSLRTPVFILIFRIKIRIGKEERTGYFKGSPSERRPDKKTNLESCT